MTNETVTPTPGNSQSIADIIDALEFEDEDGVSHQAGFFTEADPHVILGHIISVISAAKAVVAFNPEAISAFGNATHGVDTFCTMASNIDHALAGRPSPWPSDHTPAVPGAACVYVATDHRWLLMP